jgi:hypothetical protein
MGLNQLKFRSDESGNVRIKESAQTGPPTPEHWKPEL